MLTNLTIKNYALIDQLQVEFQEGFTTITGETGAGKSILLGALGLVLGKRADKTHLHNKESKCIIEAEFDIDNYELQNFFTLNDLDYDSVTILRREILPNGKSRAFVNDTPTNLHVLTTLSKYLIDVHSQHQTKQLEEVQFYYNLLDALALNQKLITAYQLELKIYKKAKQQLITLLEKQKTSKEAFDYNLHLYDELEAANLITNEQEQIEQQLEVVNNAEVIKSNLLNAINTATTEEVGLLDMLAHFKNNLKNISPFSEAYQDLFTRTESVSIELIDIVAALASLSENTNFNPSELETLNNRLQLILNLQAKHSVASIEALLTKKELLQQKIAIVENASETIKTAETAINLSKDKLMKLAKKISENRKKAIPKLEKQLKENLQQLEMPNAHIKFEMQTLDTFQDNGIDGLEILFSANKGVAFKALKKVASGGELSRIMLSIKSILSNYTKLPTIIFDEIDTGVSGEISKSIAHIMKQMASNMQVISITHLPQVAAAGLQQLKVYKVEEANKVHTKLKPLNTQERIVEIASMIGGKNPSESAKQHAKELLN